MIWLYRLLFLPVFFVMLPRYVWRMLRRGGYSRGFQHRLGFFPALPPKKPGVRRIWLQAVSVGEVAATEPLLRELAAAGKTEVVLTTTTSTGYDIAREKLTALTLATGIFPMDFWFANALAWRRIQPDLVVLMEGELWPEHLRRARKHGVPAVLINARLSDRSHRRFTRFKGVAKWLFGFLDYIGVSNHEDARRFFHLGIPSEKIILTGNLKFDASAAASSAAAAAGAASGDAASADAAKVALRRSLGFGKDESVPILLGSSTWPGEEAMLLEVMRQVRKQKLPLRLLLVPRHAERRDEIVALLEKSDLRWVLRSKEPDASTKHVDVCVADTTGELSRLTRLATLAFIGKSLPPNDGGQSPIDCAAAGVPMVFGPCMTNFREACRDLLADKAAIGVGHAGEAVAVLSALLQDEAQRALMSKNARRWLADNQGATHATIAVLEKVFAKI